MDPSPEQMEEQQPVPSGRVKGRRSWLSWGVLVGIFAVVITVGAAVGSWNQPRQDAKLPSISSQRATSDELLRQAEAARASGDTTKAVTLSAKALAADGTNAAAKKLHDELTSSNGSSGSEGESGGSSGATGSADATGSGGTSKPDPNAGYTEKVASISALLPGTATGWDFGTPLVVSDSASVSGGKGSSSDRFIWTVRDMGSAAKAQAFLTKTSAVLYAKDKANVTVHGAPAYFGTDGASIATVAYARGRYAFELLAPKGSSLSSAKTAALAAGAMFRDTPVR